MPDTISTYHTFVQGTKARSSEVNTNFSNHRGTLLPVNEDTASASDLSHDLGASDKRWRIGYMGELTLGYTSTGWNIAEASMAGGDLVFKKNGTESVRIPSPASDFTFGTLAPPAVFVTAGSGIATISAAPLTLNPRGRPVEVCLLNNLALGQLTISATTHTAQLFANIYLYKDSAEIGHFTAGYGGVYNVTATADTAGTMRILETGSQAFLTVANGSVRFIDSDLDNTTCTYELLAQVGSQSVLTVMTGTAIMVRRL